MTATNDKSQQPTTAHNKPRQTTTTTATTKATTTEKNSNNGEDHDDDKTRQEYAERAKRTTSVNGPRSASVAHPSGRMGAEDVHFAIIAVHTTSHDHDNHYDDKRGKRDSDGL